MGPKVVRRRVSAVRTNAVLERGASTKKGNKMITDFLKTTRSKDELKHALEVLREFKECESQEEWLMVAFAAWAKLEQLEEFLAHLVEGDPLADDTVAYIESSNVPANRLDAAGGESSERSERG